MSRHIPESQLALHARGDLGFWLRHRVERHLSSCDECAQIVNDFAELRSQVAQEAIELPDELSGLQWSALSREMTANIHLGLAAGECVAERPVFASRPRLTLALASFAVVLVLAGLEQPRAATPITDSEVPTLEASGTAIAVQSRGHMLSIPRTAGPADIRTVNTRGEIGSRNVDDTGVGVTITSVNLYAE